MSHQKYESIKEGFWKMFSKACFGKQNSPKSVHERKKMNKNKKILHVVPYLKDFFLGSIVVWCYILDINLHVICTIHHGFTMFHGQKHGIAMITSRNTWKNHDTFLNKTLSIKCSQLYIKHFFFFFNSIWNQLIFLMYPGHV